MTVNEPFVPNIVSNRRHWNPNFDNTHQHDAHEAFQTLLSACDAVGAIRLYHIMQDEYSTLKHTTPSWNIFGGINMEIVKCSHCGKTITTYDTFNNLQLGIEHLVTKTIEHAIHQSFGEEPLEDTCDECASVNAREQRTSIERCEPV